MYRDRQEHAGHTYEDEELFERRNYCNHCMCALNVPDDPDSQEVMPELCAVCVALL